MQITAKEVLQAIAQLADNKACGSDKISAEHLKHASPYWAASSDGVSVRLCFVEYCHLCVSIYFFSVKSTKYRSACVCSDNIGVQIESVGQSF